LKSTIVIYHGKCPDGFGAAFAAWLTFGDTAEYLPADYVDAPPDVTGRDVYILDFSYKKAVMEQMDRAAKSIILLDHHKTAMDGLAGFTCFCGQIHFDLTKSGAMLAWEHFHPGVPAPALIRHIEDRDLWKWALPNSNEFLAFLDTLPFAFESWHTLLDEAAPQFAKALEVGTLLHERVVAICRNIAADAVPVTLEGRAGLMVSCSAELTSMVGSMLAEKTGTFGLIWRMEARGSIKVSLRAVRSFDVEDIAVRFGGGGHPQAASFRLPTARGIELLEGRLNLHPPGARLAI
jgi:oligoribonuclease NrnB/cAMP/cGMP phosphodiesterase (DHH superfamily)